MYLPDNFGILFYSLTRLNSTVENLQFHRENIEGKVKDNHTYLSSYYLHHLIETTNFTREELYALVQRAAFEGQKANSADAFFDTLTADLKEKNIELDMPRPSYEEIRKIYLKHVDTIYQRSFDLY
jgi:adenylosuccinate lyase